MSPAHLQRYVNEFAGRHNQRACDTLVQMRIMVAHMVRKRLRFKDLAVGQKNPDARAQLGRRARRRLSETVSCAIPLGHGRAEGNHD